MSGKVYRFFSKHITGGRCLVKITENKMIKFMRSEGYENKTDEQLVEMFVERYKAVIDYSETKSNQARFIDKTDPIISENFIFARASGESPRKAYDNCKLKPNDESEYDFVKKSKKYTLVSIIDDAYRYINNDDEVLNLLRMLKLYKLNKKSVYTVGIGNSEYIFFLPKD